MAIVTRQAQKADFETKLKSTIKASSLISVNKPLAIAMFSAAKFQKSIKQR